VRLAINFGGKTHEIKTRQGGLRILKLWSSSFVGPRDWGEKIRQLLGEKVNKCLIGPVRPSANDLTRMRT
jgi:hypothetical protein